MGNGDFVDKGKNKLSGIVTKGLGEGAIFISMPHYKNEIREKLDFDPFPGTLNIKTGKSHINALKSLPVVRINGFEKDGKKFGGADCHRIMIENTQGAIISPDLTRHEKEIVEIIAPIHLRSKLKISDGDKIKVKLVQH